MDSEHASEFRRLSQLEFAAGWVPGHTPWVQATGTTGKQLSPIAALESILLPALQTDPCIIGFSGGRDSSALLAVAIKLARRLGFPDPVPVTNRYPGIPEADENAWQEVVIRHLDVKEWARRDISTELDLLGPNAQQSLEQFGVLWPATLHNRAHTISVARGGCYIDGEGGDEILGEFRVTPIAQLLHRERRVNRDALRKSLRALSPGLVRLPYERRRIGANNDRAWLRPGAAAWYLQTTAADEAHVPLHYARAVRRVATRRAVKVAITNLDAMGRTLDVQYLHPLLDPRFITALVQSAPALGYTSRTAAMRALFHDVLPDAILSRDQKAYFNHAFVQDHTRTFLDVWDGTGLDDELIDADVLRSLWKEPRIHGGTFHLIHAAWMAKNT
jgi:asparagine synthetase B (glutamine-hydrolysing)